MRIRSIRPEFWSSEDIAALTWEHRLIYIGLWSYVDDNGVGRDIERLILADLFPLEEDAQGALMQIAGALKSLQTRRMITRYKVDGKPFLHITAWETHQKINRPSAQRYPLPTSADVEAHVTLIEGSLSAQDDLPLGEGEKGRRGEGEKAPRPTAAQRIEQDFNTWYDIYPKKIGKPDALAKYKTARKKTDAASLLSGARVLAKAFANADKKFCPNPSTWLHQERWNDAEPSTEETLTDAQCDAEIGPLYFTPIERDDYASSEERRADLKAQMVAERERRRAEVRARHARKSA